MPLTAGTRLGAYEILAPLGDGRHGRGLPRARLAPRPRGGDQGAPRGGGRRSRSGSPGSSARRARWRRSTTRTSSRIFEVEEDGGIRFLAMELRRGREPGSLLAPGGLPLPRFDAIALPLAERAVGRARARHRAPGPEARQRHGHARRAREGARLRPGQAGERADPIPTSGSTPTESRADLTSEGQVLRNGRLTCPRSRRAARTWTRGRTSFRCGVVLYQMLTGERPFRGATAADLISSILRDTPVPVTDLREDLPPHLARIVRRCLEKDPRDRYQTSRDVYNELRDLQRDASAPPPAGASATPDRPAIAERSRRPLACGRGPRGARRARPRHLFAVAFAAAALAGRRRRAAAPGPFGRSPCSPSTTTRATPARTTSPRG